MLGELFWEVRFFSKARWLECLSLVASLNSTRSPGWLLSGRVSCAKDCKSWVGCERISKDWDILCFNLVVSSSRASVMFLNVNSKRLLLSCIYWTQNEC